MTARELREKYLAFFQSKGHTVYPSAPLVPIDATGREDTSLMFTGAGMVQFKPFFRGIAQPPSKRLTDVQKCLRTTDIEEVGDATHLTFFEMLGNFSFGDYFRKEAIAFSWEFMTSPDWLGLDPKRLCFTVHDSDQESFDHWAEFVRGIGLDPRQRIFFLDEETNFWPAGAFSKGPPGPCGPNTEMFYWTPNDEAPPLAPLPTSPFAGEVGKRSEPGEGYTVADYLRDCDTGKWLEIWNDVFIQYEWKGKLKNPDRPSDGWEKEGMDPLPFQSVDTGMGLERTITALNGAGSVYENDLFELVFAAIRSARSGMGVSPMRSSTVPVEHSGDPGRDAPATHDRDDHATALVAERIIADHLRAACFCIADGILPSNTGRGYVLRRLIRRAVLKGQRVLGIEEPFLHKVYEGVAEALGGHYTELIERREMIVETLRNEEGLFRRTLRRGFEEVVDRSRRHFFEIEEKYADLVRRSELKTPSSGRLLDLLNRPFEDYEEPGGFRDWILARADMLGAEDESLSEIGKLKSEIRRSLDGGLESPAARSLRRLIDDFRLPGKEAFLLYDTYGFPLEVTQELCQEAGIEVDLDGFEAAMKEAQERSKAAHSGDTVYGGVTVTIDLFALYDHPGRADQSDRTGKTPTPTVFTGYQETTSQAAIVGALPVTKDDGTPTNEIVVALDRSPFYAESGGQVSDTGTIEGVGFKFHVVDLIKQDGVIVHMCEVLEGEEFDLSGKDPNEARGFLQGRLFGQPVNAKVDAPRRRRIIRNHSATHLLHAALRSVLGKHVTQAGSLVSPEHLRFDFTHGKAMTPEELAEVERIVNNQVLASDPVRIHENVPIATAKERGAMALFGEKYGDTVRMVEVERSEGDGAFSIELCGGCHVRNTAEIGLFKILHESSAASGVRRIEAVTGEGAYEWALEQDRNLKEAAAALKTSSAELTNGIKRLQDQLREEKKRLEKLRTQQADGAEAQTVQVGAVELAVQYLEDADMKEATLVADRLAEGQPNRVSVVGAASEGKVSLVVKSGTEALTKGAHAGNLVREIAKLVGGGGGGRPDFATAGGKDVGALQDALAKAQELLAAQLDP